MKKQEEEIFDSLKIAHSQVEQATSLFNELTDKTAVDYAYYNLQAAKAKYAYLIQLAKEMNMTI